MICPSCGQENRESARFCDGCAASLAPQEEQDATPLSMDFVPSRILVVDDESVVTEVVEQYLIREGWY